MSRSDQHGTASAQVGRRGASPTRSRQHVDEELLDAVHRLVGAARAAGIGSDDPASARDDHDSVASSPQQALLRLIRGQARANEETFLPIPVEGGRLLAVNLVDAEASAILHSLPVPKTSQLIAVTSPNELAVLIRNSPRRAGHDRGLAAALGISGQLRRRAPGAAIGISSPLATVGDLRAAWLDCCDAAKLARRDGSNIACVDDVWATITIDRLSRHLSDCLPLSNPIAHLRRLDHSSGSAYLDSAGTWLWSNQDTLASARTLNVHPNTLRYRLRRMHDLAGLDLTDARQRLVTQLLAGAARSVDGEASNRDAFRPLN